MTGSRIKPQGARCRVSIGCAPVLVRSLVRDYLPAHRIAVDGGWNIADAVSRSYDLEGMEVGTVAAGRIGTERVEGMVGVCDVVTINAPLHQEIEHLFNQGLVSKMKRGAYIVNTARGKIREREAIVQALESGHLAGYAGEVWFPQPAPADHPWRSMPHHGMTPHISGRTLSAQTRYAAGTREILEPYFAGQPIRDEYLIVGGRLAGAGAHSYSEGNATAGSDEVGLGAAPAGHPSA